MKTHPDTFLMQTGCISIITVFAMTLYFTSPTDGDFWWFDSSRHALNGIFIRDFLLEGGLLHPIRFAADYYRQYPGINIGFYPPFLYMSSAPFLAVFGTSHAVSQAVVILYALAAGTLTYLICVRQMDSLASLTTALCVLALPETALWARQVQLDVPAVALLLATAYSLIRHIESGHRGWMFAAAVCLGLSVLTRVQAVYAVPVVLFFLFLYRYDQRPALRSRLVAIVAFGIIALPSVVMVAYFSQLNQALAVQMPDMPKLLSLENWIWYANRLPQQMGWPALVLTGAGLIAGAIAFKKEGIGCPVKVVGAFCICSWIFFSVVSNKAARFNLPSLPFLFIVSAWGLYLLMPRLARIALPGLAAWLVIQVWFMSPVAVVAGFREAVLVAQSITPKNRNVLISAHRDGTFIYNMRTVGNRRDIGVRRADKLFVQINIMRELGIKDNKLDQKAILDLLEQQNVSTVVMQTGYLPDQSSMQNFQKILEAGLHYERVQTIALRGATRHDEHELVVFRKR
jgi:hypothetical protein